MFKQRVNKILLSPASEADPEEILRAADEAGLRDHSIFQTSGSTGVPKFVCLSEMALEISAQAVNAFLDATETDTWLLALPEYHVGGFAIRVRARLSGSTVVTLSGKWSPDAFPDGITLVSLVPAQLFDLVEGGNRPPASLRAALIGGGRLAAELRDRATALGWPVIETYGMTEAGSQIATGGRVLPVWQTRTDPDGRLSIKGPALFSGYLSEKGVEPAQEWFQTSDIVRLDGDRLHFIGRTDDIVKILGELVNVPLLESSLPAGCAIAACPHPRKEHELILVSEQEVTGAEQTLKAFNSRCAGFERLSRVVSVAKIPRSGLGKIRRKKLRDLVCSS